MYEATPRVLDPCNVGGSYLMTTLSVPLRIWCHSHNVTILADAICRLKLPNFLGGFLFIHLCLQHGSRQYCPAHKLRLTTVPGSGFCLRYFLQKNLNLIPVSILILNNKDILMTSVLVIWICGDSVGF